MNIIYMLKRKWGLYCLMTLFALYFVFGTVFCDMVWAEEGSEQSATTSQNIEEKQPICNVQMSNDGISKDYLVVTYYAENIAEGVTMYRKVEKMTSEGWLLLHEGEIVWEEMDEASSQQMSEVYSNSAMEGLDQYYLVTDGTYKVTCYGKDAKGNSITDSEQEYTFIIDSTPPEAVLTCLDEDRMATDSVRCTLGVSDANFDSTGIVIVAQRRTSDGVTITDRLESESFQNNSEKELLFEEEGYYTVYANIRDLAGNIVETEKVNFIIDRTAPIISDVIYSDSGNVLLQRFHNIYSKEEILLEFSVLDGIAGVEEEEVFVTLGDMEDREESTPCYPAFQTSGNRYYVRLPMDAKTKEFIGKVTIWARDVLKNESSLMSADIVCTKEKPSIQMDCNSDYDKWSKEDVTFHTTVIDKTAGLQQVTYKVNGKTVKKIKFDELTQSYEYDITASESADKSTGYAIVVEVTNNCGTTHTERRQVFVDKEKPTIRLSGIENGVYYRTSQTFTTDVSDISHANIIYYATCTLDGKKVSVSIEDFQSRKQEESCVRKVIQEGRYQIYAIATDSAGNCIKSNVLNFVIDKTAPVLEMVGASNGGMYKEAVVLRMKCTESFFETNEVDVEIKKELDGKTTITEIEDFPANKKVTSASHTFEKDGTYTVTMKTRDKAGNIAKTKQITFSVDRTKPILRIVGTENYQLQSEPIDLRFVVEESYYWDNKVTITGTRTDIDGVTEELKFPRFASTKRISSLQHLFEKDGRYEICIQAQDDAGNTSSKRVTFTLDQTIPEIRGVEKYQGGCFSSFRLAESLEDVFRDLTVVSYEMLLNGVEYNGIDTIVAEGKYNLYIKVVDELGHTNIKNIEFLITGLPAEGASTSNHHEEVTVINETIEENMIGNEVTKERVIIYNKLLIVALIVSVLAIGCVWIGSHIGKKKRKSRYDESSSI